MSKGTYQQSLSFDKMILMIYRIYVILYKSGISLVQLISKLIFFVKVDYKIREHWIFL